MEHLFTREGLEKLSAFCRRRPLIACDFDGTLAPIKPRPEEVTLPTPVQRQLESIALNYPVAIITGRAKEDVRRRLGFDPHFIIGNHGADFQISAERNNNLQAALDPIRQKWAGSQTAFSKHHIRLEDKGLSIAFHYRLSPNQAHSHDFLENWLASFLNLKIFPGKCVINVMAQQALDKAGAISALMHKKEFQYLIYLGDDANDEPVFRVSNPNWLTIKIGRQHSLSRAQYYLDSTNEVALLLQIIQKNTAPLI
jgi:trehalose 6-phosphate phosphatase